MDVFSLDNVKHHVNDGDLINKGVDVALAAIDDLVKQCDDEDDDDAIYDSDSEDDESDDDEEYENMDLNDEEEPVDLREYYKTLDLSQVKEDIEILKIASLREAYQLIEGNCKYYLSIIENYKEYNLQNKLNMIVRRIEGHLLIKFRLNATDRWAEVAFFDEHNTDEETIRELGNIIRFYIKNTEIVSENRRKHLAAQFDEEDDTPIDVEKHKPKHQAIPDDHFDPEKNPELKVTDVH